MRCPDEMPTFWQFGSKTEQWEPKSSEESPIFSVTCSEPRSTNPPKFDLDSCTTTTTSTTIATSTTTTDTSATSDSSKVEDDNGKQFIASLGSLLKEINLATSSLPPGLSNPTSSEDLKALEPPADAQDKDAPRRFVFQDMRDFSPRGSFGFLAVNSSYRPYFPQGGGTKVT